MAILIRRLAAVCLALAVAGVCRPASAQTVPEPALRAAFVLNFAKFAQWPGDGVAASAPLVLCSTDAAVAAELDTMTAGRAIDGHPLVSRRVSIDEPIGACSVLYLGGVEKRRLAGVLASIEGTPVLTVGESAEFAGWGGMIGLFLDDGRMRFAINIDRAGRARLRLSAKLLTLAQIVKD
jgi:hypothetical protein